MNLLGIQRYSSRNIYCHKPVIRMELDLEGLYDVPTKDICGFNDNLLKHFPGFQNHFCSRGKPGGFIERLYEGTYLAHVIEHLAIELQCWLGYDVSFGKTRILREPSIYNVIFESVDEKLGVECGRAAFAIATELIEGNDGSIDGILASLEKTSSECSLGPSTRAILEEAQKRGIPVSRLGQESLLRLGYGKYSRIVQASLTDVPNCISVDISGNKQLTKQILSEHGIPVPYGEIAYTEQAALWIAREIGYPVVVKPFDANQGKGVTLDVRNDSQLSEAYREAAKFSRAVIVERFIRGKDYRILVVGNKVSAVSERRPPSVIGDGIHSIRQLVDIENHSVHRGSNHEKPLTRIKLDGIARQALKRRGLEEDSIPEAGDVVYLRENGNLSTGGTARDCTEEIAPYNRELAVRAAKAIGLDIAGIDMTAEDISKPIGKDNGAVIEINAAPGLRMHLYPTEGKPRNVAADILDMLFPPGTQYTIPIVSITGTNGKTTTTRLIAHIVSLTGKTVGMTTTNGVFINGECIRKGDCTGPVSAATVLSDREVEAAILETARGGIIKKGLGYDLADVGVVTNISEDHLGLDGVESLEDLAYVKALVVEAVKPDGYAVLNADDAMTPYFLKRARSRTLLFSRSENNPLLLESLRSKGKAVYVKHGVVCMEEGGVSVALLPVEEIPITCGGKAICNIENVLAAVSAAFAMDIPASIIKAGLLSFLPDVKLNPGRFNIFDMGNFKVMLDYGHNPAGYRAVGDFIARMGEGRPVGVIGVPGDRSDESIREVGSICSRMFEKVYIKEDDDLRGRAPGEVADLLFDAVIQGGLGKESIEVVFSETRALEAAMHDAQPGDFIVVFYEHFEPLVKVIENFEEESAEHVKVCSPMLEGSAG